MAHPDRAFAGLAHDREDLGQHCVERLALLEPVLELGGLRLQLGVRQRRELLVEGIDGTRGAPEARHVPFVTVY